jgi:hypothetical protein
MRKKSCLDSAMVIKSEYSPNQKRKKEIDAGDEHFENN